MKKKYNINQCALYKCTTKKKLEKVLHLEVGTLKHIKHIISYHSFQIDKKTPGEKREISAPDVTLKLVQKRILNLLQYIQRPDWLISGEKGKSYISNGIAHMNNSYMLAIDIRKFYNNCKRNKVYSFFKDTMLTTPDVACILTDIITFNGGIPTGCPTSQLIAYYAYEKMFIEIAEIAKKHGCIFTLYVDDMTFSSRNPIDPQKLAREVDLVLRKYGHRPKYKKIKYYSKNVPKPITGTIVTPQHNLDVPNSLQKKIYDNFQMIKRLDCISSDEEEKIKQSLLGQIQAARQLNSDKFPEIERITKNIKSREFN